MIIMNEHNYEEIEKLLNKLIEKKVYEILDNLGIESSSYGKVKEINISTPDADGNTTSVTRATIETANGEIVENIFNATGEVLNIGDNVKIYGSRSNMSNRYIGIKYKKEEVL